MRIIPELVARKTSCVFAAFNQNPEQGRFAQFARIDMMRRVAGLRVQAKMRTDKLAHAREHGVINRLDASPHQRRFDNAPNWDLIDRRRIVTRPDPQIDKLTDPIRPIGPDLLEHPLLLICQFSGRYGAAFNVAFRVDQTALATVWITYDV